MKKWIFIKNQVLASWLTYFYEALRYYQLISYHNQSRRAFIILLITGLLLLLPSNWLVKLFSKFASAYNNRGDFYYNQHKYELALSDYSKAIKLNPKDADYYNNRGLVYDYQKKYELALSDYNKAIELDPKFAQPYNGRGNVYYNQQKYDLALSDYNKAIELDPKFAQPYNGRGLVYEALKQYQKSLEDYEKFAQLYRQEGSESDYQNVLKDIERVKEKMR